MAKVNRKISDDDLLLALLTTESQTAAAKQLGCSKVTISRRIQDPQFKEKLNLYRRTLLDTVSNKLVQSTSKAVDVLIALLDSESESTRYNTASKILSIAQDFIVQEDIMQRLDKLEQQDTML